MLVASDLGDAGQADVEEADARSRSRVPSMFSARTAVVVAVFLVGGLHGLLYAVSFPPWAIEDEGQHVDYAAARADGE